MSESMTSKMITLGSNDGAVFLVPETVAKQSQVLRHLIDDPNQKAYYNNSFLLQKVTAPILAKVIEYCRKHADAEEVSKTETTEEGSSTTLTSSKLSDEELRNWDKQFLDVDPVTLGDLFMAAAHLDIKGLWDVLGKKVADTTKGKMVRLISNDAVVFVVPKTMLKQFQLLRHLIDDPYHRAHYNNTTFLPKVTAPILAKLIEYCRKHADAGEASKTETTEEGSSTTMASSRISDEELRNWDKQFLDVDPQMLFDLTMAAEDLKIEGLQDVLKKKNFDNIIRDRDHEFRKFIPKWLYPK